eukprot:INCI4878.1.p1 GENE.INCI4878.1~~INCI4878.1.p1  ORF type:complete len:417 (+),score=61.85 INCI4878.1:117-1253(+)
MATRAATALLLVAFAGQTSAECPNLCSGHGNCDNNDQCHCYKEGKVLNKEGNDDEDVLFAQWTGADCSMLSCPRGVSWTTVSGATTHEKSAECSDAGICDRSTGQCECFEKYTGSACQRTECINGCSGHGVCTSNKDLAEQYARHMSTSINLRQRMPRCDGSPSEENCVRNVDHLEAFYDTYLASYNSAWDSGLHYGCVCDLGYQGNDCSLRECPSNFDPVDGNCVVTLVDEEELDILADVDGLYTPWSTESSMEKIADTQAGDYLALYGTSQVFSEPASFVTLRRSNSDLARSCIAFYNDGSHGLDLTDDLVVYPLNTDSWVCNYLWDSNFVKVPVCGGRLAAQECSGRGLCDRSNGQCACFSGYGSKDCSEANNVV